jgi:hypothetical protein
MISVKEEWRYVSGYGGDYSVSNLGRIMSNERTDASGHKLKARIMSQTKTGNGYMRIALRHKHKLFVHRIVAEEFIGRGIDGLQVNHKNGDKTDNRADNLEWVTCSENHKHSFRVLGRKPSRAMLGMFADKNPNAKQVEMTDGLGNVIKKFKSASLAVADGFNVSCIIACCRGRRNTHGGFCWQYSQAGGVA